MQRYKYAIVFVDQAPVLGYVQLQKSANAEESVLTKQSFESYMIDLGIDVKAYHVDDGIFCANERVDACEANHQRLTCTDVNAHHQNGIAERRIREFQEFSRTMMMDGNHKWLISILTSLWPYPLRMANEVYNNDPSAQHNNAKSPSQVASGSEVVINQMHYKTFGCPVFVLNQKMQQGKPFDKWLKRSTVGIYLGPPFHHNRNIPFVLDRDTGLVSHQFHVIFVNELETVVEDKYDDQWKLKAGFITQREHDEIQRKVEKILTKIPGVNDKKGIVDSEGVKDVTIHPTNASKRKRLTSYKGIKGVDPLPEPKRSKLTFIIKPKVN